MLVTGGSRGCRTLYRAGLTAQLAARHSPFALLHHSSSSSSSLITPEVLAAARQKQSGVSLQTLLTFGRAATRGGPAVGHAALQTSSQFLHRELPIRLAHRMVELESLPGGLSRMPSVRSILEWYASSFREIRAHPLPTDLAAEASFTRLLASIYEKHSPTLVTMARGLGELKRELGVRPGEPLPDAIGAPLAAWLDIFFSARLGVRTLIGQHVAMHSPSEGFVGLIHPACSPRDIVADAAEDAREMCLRNFPDAPEVTISGDTGLRFPFVPMILRHVVFELLKNSMRATVEEARRKQGEKEAAAAANGKGPSSSSAALPDLPPIEVVIASAGEDEGGDVAIRISDRGGGISRAGMRGIFSYAYTTAPPVSLVDEDGGGSGGPRGADFSTRAPMFGMGFGIPLSRVLARYYGGDLSILSMPRFGTDAYIFLRRLGDASEPLSEASPAVSGFARSLARRGSDGARAPGEGAAAAAGDQHDDDEEEEGGEPGMVRGDGQVHNFAGGGAGGWGVGGGVGVAGGGGGGGGHASFRVSIRSALPDAPSVTGAAGGDKGAGSGSIGSRSGGSGSRSGGKRV